MGFAVMSMISRMLGFSNSIVSSYEPGLTMPNKQKSLLYKNSTANLSKVLLVEKVSACLDAKVRIRFCQ